MLQRTKINDSISGSGWPNCLNKFTLRGLNEHSKGHKKTLLKLYLHSLNHFSPFFAAALSHRTISKARPTADVGSVNRLKGIHFHLSSSASFYLFLTLSSKKEKQRGHRSTRVSKAASGPSRPGFDSQLGPNFFKGKTCRCC